MNRMKRGTDDFRFFERQSYHAVTPLKHVLTALSLLLLLGGGFTLLAVVTPGAAPITARAENLDDEPAPTEAAFIPYIPRWQYSSYVSQFGFEAHINSNWNRSWFTQLASQAGFYWARLPAFSWADIQPDEPNPDPVYHWETVQNDWLMQAASSGFEIIATIKHTPYWAQKVKDHSCSAIEEEDFAEFAAFLRELVTIYSAPPYNILYYELGNEIDVAPSQVAADSQFGCWGDLSDPYFGGRHYGKMLKVAYPAIKAANPKAQVLIGGLLLDCDPRYPPPSGCLAGKFFEGMLIEGAGPYFDYVSFHGYAYWTDQLNDTITYNLYLDQNHWKWYHNGGVLIGKIAFLRDMMQSYGINKPIFNSETGLIGYSDPSWVPPDRFYQDQATYVIWQFIRGWAVGLKGTIWYTLDAPGWRYAGLAYWNYQTPAYQAMSFLTAELDHAFYAGRVYDYPDLNGYAFVVVDKRVWVLWSPVQRDVTITLPANTLQVRDKFGAPITPTDNQITVNDPVYIEIAK